MQTIIFNYLKYELNKCIRYTEIINNTMTVEGINDHIT